MADEMAVRATGLSKQFGKVQAVSDVDIGVARGEALGLLGPNGAGKSTTLSMLMGLQTPDAGHAMIFGHAAGSVAARAICGATPQSTDLPNALTPREILSYTAARYGTDPKTGALVERFALETLIDRRVAGFSGGELRRVALALAFVGEPKLVFLDEPTAGLDTASQDRFREMAQDYVAQGGTLILTSHQWDEIEAICSTIALIDQGQMVLGGGMEEMRQRANVTRLTFGLPDGCRPPAWMKAQQDGHLWSLETTDSDTVLRRVVEEGVPFEGLTLEPLKLKDLIDRIHQEEMSQ